MRNITNSNNGNYRESLTFYVFYNVIGRVSWTDYYHQRR